MWELSEPAFPTIRLKIVKLKAITALNNAPFNAAHNVQCESKK